MSEVLIHAGARVNKPDAEMGSTPLMVAGANNDTEMMMMLLKHGANAGARDAEGDDVHAYPTPDEQPHVHAFMAAEEVRRSIVQEAAAVGLRRATATSDDEEPSEKPGEEKHGEGAGEKPGEEPSEQPGEKAGEEPGEEPGTVAATNVGPPAAAALAVTLAEDESTTAVSSPQPADPTPATEAAPAASPPKTPAAKRRGGWLRRVLCGCCCRPSHERRPTLWTADVLTLSRVERAAAEAARAEGGAPSPIARSPSKRRYQGSWAWSAYDDPCEDYPY